MTHSDIKLQRVLVVAPLNTVLNWQVEFEKWLAVDDRLEVITSCLVERYWCVFQTITNQETATVP